MMPKIGHPRSAGASLFVVFGFRCVHSGGPGTQSSSRLSGDILSGVVGGRKRHD